MGTKVHRDSYFPYTMRGLNEEFDNSNGPMCYRDNPITNGKYYYGFINKTTTDTYPDSEKDALKQRMLEHEAIFKGQLYELHRLYRIQREMMEEAKKKELHRLQVTIEQPSSSSSGLCRSHLLPSGGFPLLNSGYGEPSTSRVAIENSPSACREEYNARPVQFPFQNGPSLKECDALSSRPSKVRKKLFDLQLPPEENTGFEEETIDLNQPIRIGVDTANEDARQVNELDKSSTRSVGVNGESILNDGFLTKSGVENKVNNEKRVPHIYEAGYSKSTLYMQDKLPSASYKNSLVYSNQNRAQSNSWAHSVMSGGEKKAKFDSIATMDQSLLPSAQSQELPLGGNWLVNASSGLNYTGDGFYQPPKLSSPLSSFSNIHCNRDNEMRRKVEKQTIDINLNEEADEENMTGDNHSALPWLRHKGASASNDGEIEMKKEAKTVKKILGNPIFDSVARANEPATVGLHTERNGIDNEHKKRVIDINLECEPADEEPTLEKENRSVRDLIDLNSCVIDSEDHLSSESKTHHRVKRVLEIDLEAPPPLQESDDDTEENTALVNEVEQIHDEEALQKAAETIFAISSFRPQEAHAEEGCRRLSEASSSSDPLFWFVDIVSSFAGDDDESPEIDEFEAMTLQLREMKEDKDYMPRPFVPEFQELEERGTNNSSVTRPRRGHYRRGRQRKDFQGDILPGLAALSRHEVTEDIQTFGGLMRATGHHWNSALTRRSGGVRGRRRAVSETLSNVVVCAAHVVQKLDHIETVLEDRSLTGWGKTTRRPRRQRCHAGNNPLMAVLTR